MSFNKITQLITKFLQKITKRSEIDDGIMINADLSIQNHINTKKISILADKFMVILASIDHNDVMHIVPRLNDHVRQRAGLRGSSMMEKEESTRIAENFIAKINKYYPIEAKHLPEGSKWFKEVFEGLFVIFEVIDHRIAFKTLIDNKPKNMLELGAEIIRLHENPAPFIDASQTYKMDSTIDHMKRLRERSEQQDNELNYLNRAKR